MSYQMEELLPLVAKLTEKYTSNESSSVTYDKAKQLMQAILYCIHEYEAQQESANKQNKCSYSLVNDTKLPPEEAYQLGYDLVIRKVKATLATYDALILTFRSYENRNYYDTIVKGMPAFFKYYDAKFEPQNHLLTLDYPTIIHPTEYCGVDLIHIYLNFVSLEQMFLSRFSDEYVYAVLNGYHEEYRELPINICQIVLRTVIGDLIANKRITEYGFSKREYDDIREFVADKELEELQQALTFYLKLLINKGYDQNESLYNYLVADMNDFAVELRNVVKHNCMEVLFPI